MSSIDGRSEAEPNTRPSTLPPPAPRLGGRARRRRKRMLVRREAASYSPVLRG